MTDTSQSGPEIDERLAGCLQLASQMNALAGLYPGVVHDLKSPLNALVVNLELLKSSISGTPDVDRQRRYVRILDEELVRLNRAIERLLPAAAPPGDGRGRYDLGQVTRDVEALLSPRARQQRVALELTVPDEPVILDGPRDLIRQALLAVALNGLEAMPGGGTLAVAVTSDGVRAVVSVTDTGPGIPSDMGERAFELYTSTKGGHRGLGLFVARTVVESVSGTLLHSIVRGRGCRFDLTLPLAAKANQEY